MIDLRLLAILGALAVIVEVASRPLRSARRPLAEGADAGTASPAVPAPGITLFKGTKGPSARPLTGPIRIRTRPGPAAIPEGATVAATPIAPAPPPTPVPAPAPVAPEPPPPAPARPAPQSKIPRGPELHVSEDERARRLDVAVNGLRTRDPELSAAVLFSRRQRTALIVLVAGIAAGLVVNAPWTLITLTGLATAMYSASLLFRLKLFRLSLGPATAIEITEDEARSAPESELPTYTVLVPAFREPEVVAKLIQSVGQLEYPADKLQILLLLEEDDEETVDAARRSEGVERFDIVLVPTAQPRTKPKALNYGLQFAIGELLTIFDAEDRPEPLQLRRAAIALGRADDDIICLQAELGYYNPTQNLITRWFSIEYLMWFTQLLPGLSFLQAPVPLGGTSNHFRRQGLEDLGGWDPFNVTEDADLGVRLHRLGYRTGVLASETLEEANSDFVNWVKQRSRWYKGYIQTWIVHMRHPLRLRKELGGAGFNRFNSFVGGTPLLAFVNPIFWALTLVWFVGHPGLIKAIYPSPIFYTALACWLAGNFICVYTMMLCSVDAKRSDLFLAAVLNPLYWMMMSVAAAKALFQVVFQASYWEKTAHGLDTPGDASAPGDTTAVT